MPVDGTAEATSLPSGSLAWLSAGQAFHWFDVPATALEARRILRPGGLAVLVWNTRRSEDLPFARDYEALLQHCSLDYHQVVQARPSWEADFRHFFGGDWATYGFDNRQYTDLDGLRGRTLSASYAPLPGHPFHKPLVEGLQALFERYAENGQVSFEYETQVHIGPLRGRRRFATPPLQ